MFNLRTYLIHRRHRTELEVMNDAQLHDLGISRGEIGQYLQGRAGVAAAPTAQVIPFPPERICCQRPGRAA